jgi:DNA-binding HxlR family transcriptional regulator
MGVDPGSPPSASARIGEPVGQLLRILKGKYKPDILIHLGKGRRRFSELQRAIPGVSERMLTRHLQELERDGVILRTAFAEVPPRVEYQLTDSGRTLCPVIKQMWVWGRSRSSLAQPERG